MEIANTLLIIAVIIIIFLFAVYYFYPEQDFVRLFPVDPVTRVNGGLNGSTNGNGSMNGVNGSTNGNGVNGNGSMNGANGSTNGNGNMNGVNGNGNMNGANGSTNGNGEVIVGLTDPNGGTNGSMNGVQDTPMNGGMGEVTNGQTQSEPDSPFELAPPPPFYKDCPGLYYSPDYRYIGGVSTYGDGRYLRMTAADSSNLQTAMNRCNADPNCVAIDTAFGYFLRNYDANKQRANPQDDPCLGIFVKV